LHPVPLLQLAVVRPVPMFPCISERDLTSAQRKEERAILITLRGSRTTQLHSGNPHCSPVRGGLECSRMTRDGPVPGRGTVHGEEAPSRSWTRCPLWRGGSRKPADLQHLAGHPRHH